MIIWPNEVLIFFFILIILNDVFGYLSPLMSYPFLVISNHQQNFKVEATRSTWYIIFDCQIHTRKDYEEQKLRSLTVCTIIVWDATFFPLFCVTSFYSVRGWYSELCVKKCKLLSGALCRFDNEEDFGPQFLWCKFVAPELIGLPYRGKTSCWCATTASIFCIA